MTAPPKGRPILLETERFALRSLKPSDASERWQNWAKDPEVMGPLNARTREMSREYLANYASSFDNSNRYLIGIFEKAKGLHIGFFIVEVDHAHRVATFNVVVGDKTWWGKAVVNEARAALLDEFFDKRGIEKACGVPLTRNFPAVLNYKAQGWRHEGTLHGQRLSSADGSRLDQYQFGLLRDEWHRIRTRGRNDEA
jgi:RimJ/RimL family protein N-acetyltransferase